MLALGAVAALLAATDSGTKPVGGPREVIVTSSIENGQTLTDKVRWTATIRGRSSRVKRVEFRVDERRVWVDRRAPYTYGRDGRLDASRLGCGTHSLEIRVMGERGRLARRRARVEVGRLPSSQTGTLFGVHMDATWDRTSDALASIRAAEAHLHPQVSRNSLLWHMIEPTPGIRNWTRTDAVVNALVAADIEPLFTIYGSPAWANGVSTNTEDSSLYVPAPGPAFDRWLEAYVGFVRDAVKRYKCAVRKWEVWNEPNEHFFWKPAANVQQYIRFYTAIRRAILSEDPTAQVAVGGLAGLVVGCCIYATDFLRTMIDSGAQIDHVAIHPYSNHAPEVQVPDQANFDDIQAIRDLLDTNGLATAELWVTEWGWSSDLVGTETQAEWIRRSLDLIRTRYPYVRVATVFLSHDRLPTYDQGLLDANLDPKLAGEAFAAFMTNGRR